MRGATQTSKTLCNALLFNGGIVNLYSICTKREAWSIKKAQGTKPGQLNFDDDDNEQI